VDDLLDAMVTGPNPADLVEAFALPLPSLVICRLLGVAYDDHEFFQARSRALARRGVSPEDSLAAMTDLREFLAALCAAKERDPGDDLLSQLILEQVRPGNITREELVGMSVILLVAGHETTGNMAALGLLALLEHPETLAELRADPQLIPDAVEELVRYLSIIDATARVAIEDFELGGAQIRAGDALFAVLSSANRDDTVFCDPDTLDIHRRPLGHAAFGHGVHICIGAPLARIELEIGFETILRRIPTLQIAVPLSEVRFKPEMIAYGVHELPVTW
jgi:cytochrome P450